MNRCFSFVAAASLAAICGTIETRKFEQSRMTRRSRQFTKSSWVANKRFEISKFKFKFPRAPNYGMRGARSRLYRSQILQVNTRWKALAEIYTMHSFAPFFNLKISAKNRQHFFAIEYLNLHFFTLVIKFAFFCDCSMKKFPDFAISRKE